MPMGGQELKAVEVVGPTGGGVQVVALRAMDVLAEFQPDSSAPISALGASPTRAPGFPVM